MEHNNLSLEYDKNLINRILDDINLRYIILFQYIIRNDLFKDLTDTQLLESYKGVIILDEIYKNNVLKSWNEEFTEIAIDLGLIKNIRNIKEFERKDQDFIIKLGEETVTIEENTILIPDDTLFLMINKKFKHLTRRNFNLALTRLKSVRCENSGVIHSFIYQIGEKDITLSNDLYNILDQFGNIYQVIKIEITIEGFYERFREIFDNIEEFIEIYDPSLNTKNVIKKIKKSIEENKDIIQYLKDEKISLSEKFEFEKIDKNEKIFKDWYSILIQLLNFRYKMENINQELEKIRNYYTGKNRKNSYLEFIEKISFDEDNINEKIKNELIILREKIIDINKILKLLTKKQIKLLNLDYERFFITNS
ncbi:MAG: hypothetical protein KGD57_06810 [Candidatus Lokiarchaeota archaeon]|nr:hypothetical protein [Candidatus Lokiarchaeota archaeon]